MTDPVHLTLKPSNIYYLLSLGVHLATILVIWAYSINNYISFGASVFVIYGWYSLAQKISLKTPGSICSIELNQNFIYLKDNTGKVLQYPQFFCAYQSNFLVIINAGKQSLILFKDSIVGQSLSKLNLALNVKR